MRGIHSDNFALEGSDPPSSENSTGVKGRDTNTKNEARRLLGECGESLNCFKQLPQLQFVLVNVQRPETPTW